MAQNDQHSRSQNNQPAHRRSVRTDFFVVKCEKSDRFKLLSAISKKKVATAVERNAIKRRIRAAFGVLAPYRVIVTVQPLLVDAQTPYIHYISAAKLARTLCKDW